jgi:hypothetical protein
MKWTRFFRTTGASLPLAVEVEIRGIPPNAWEFPTAELLLDENCSIVVVHPSTEDRRDVFQLKAWCSNPDGFPSMMDLETVETPYGSRSTTREAYHEVSYLDRCFSFGVI